MKILVVDDEEITRTSIKASLENAKLRGATGLPNQVTLAGSINEARDHLEREIYDLAFLDIRLGHYHPNGGIELLKYLRAERPATVVIMMTSVEDHEIIEKCLLMGAADYIFKPFDYQSIHLLMIKARATHRHFRKQQTLRAQAGESAVKPVHLVTKSPSFQIILDQANRLKGTNLPVLIAGKSGVGKDLLARYLWTLEQDDSRPFVPVHAGGITATLVESELFGHTKGAFTGATENKIGKFQCAHGGDFFLDEIATMPPETQLKMLRVLQDKNVSQIGSHQTVTVNFRLICATNENLEVLIQKGQFREDLFYRIRGCILTIPRLQERKEDIPSLIDQFLVQYSMGKKTLSKSAYDLCLDYEWPGNVRQLEYAIRSSSILAAKSEITKDELVAQIITLSTPEWETAQASLTQPNPQHPFGLDEKNIYRNFKRIKREVEQRMVDLALEHTGSESGAADYLGIPRSTLISRRKSLN